MDTFTPHKNPLILKTSVEKAYFETLNDFPNQAAYLPREPALCVATNPRAATGKRKKSLPETLA
jgi:hypothetical protein